MAQDLQRSDVPLYHLDAIDFGRRMAVEKEIEKTENVPQPNAVFDESCNFLIYATLLGVKVRCTFFLSHTSFYMRLVFIYLNIFSVSCIPFVFVNM